MAIRNDRRTRTSRATVSRPARRQNAAAPRAHQADATGARPSARAGSRPSAQTGARSRARTATPSGTYSGAPSGTLPDPRTSMPSGAYAGTPSGTPTRARTDASANNLTAVAGGRYGAAGPDNPEEHMVSTSVAELRRADRAERMRKSSRRYFMRIVTVIGVIVVLLAGWAALYNSPAFTIDNVQVNGVEHLTSDEMSQLANVPEGETLLRVDTETIRNRMRQTAWVEDVEVKRVFPSTLQIDVTERVVKAIVEIPTSSTSTVKQWAIAQDHMWLMPIPDADSEAAKTTSSRIYEDAAAVLHIVDVPHGTKAEIGQICNDDNVNNALDIISGMTTELSDHVVKVSAAGAVETTLILDSGVEIAFGKAEDIRDKERVILKILEDNPDNVAYINVRMVETPTWRAV